MATYSRRAVQAVVTKQLQSYSLFSNSKARLLPLSSLRHCQNNPLWHNHQSRLYSTYKPPTNTIIMFVPQQEAWVVERMGKFHKILDPVRDAYCLHYYGANQKLTLFI